MITTTTLAACLLALLLFPLLLLLWATESKPQKIRRWRASGLTWSVCAARLNVSPSTARRWAVA
jgi:DNA-binding transcriptional regulator YiaG